MSPKRSIVLTATLGAWLAAPPSPADVTPYRPPEPVVRTLGNGLVVAVRVDHRLPIVQVQLVVPAGSAMETPLEPGLAAFTAGLLAHGTASRSSAEIDAEMARLGATIDGSASREVATLSGAFGAADVETGLELLADVALHPSFPEDAVENARTRQVNAVAQSRDDAGVLADEHINGLALAGDALGHPPGGIGSAIGGFGHTQAQDFHRRNWRPDRALLAIAGDVDPDRVQRIVEEQFGEWGGKADSVAAPAPLMTSAGLRIRLVDLPGRDRAEIRLALPGPARAASEGDALALACAVLGGDAGSRLALAGAGLTPRAVWTGFRQRGLVVLGTTARLDSVSAAVNLMRSTLRGVVEHPPLESELAPLRRRMADGYALGFETLGGWIAQWMAVRVYGLPADHLQRYPDRVRALTPETVAAAAHRWLATDHATLVVVGPAARLRATLSALGEVEVVAAGAAPVAMTPAPSQRTDPPTPAEQSRGRELIEQALAAHGGHKVIERVPDSVIEGSVTLGSGAQTMAGTIRELRRAPDRYLMFSLIQSVPNQAGLIGGSGWILGGAEGDSAVTADSSEVASLRADFNSDLQHVLLAAADPAARVAARGREKLGRRDAEVVEVVAADGGRRVLFLDPDNHRIAAYEQPETGEDGRVVAVRRLWGDYRLVSGVWWPFNEERRVLDHTVMVVQVRNVKLGAGLTDAEFVHPALKPTTSGGGKKP